jgi:hypothetical protein
LERNIGKYAGRGNEFAGKKCVREQPTELLVVTIA